MRKVEIKDKKVLTILNKKGKLSKDTQVVLDRLKEIEEEGKKLEAEFNTYLTKTKMIDEKARPYLKKIMEKIELEEYEQVSKVHQEDTGEWNIEIADRMEEFKEAFKENKE